MEDTACFLKVFGKQWIENYLSGLYIKGQSKVKIFPPSREYRLGDEALIQAVENQIIPAKIGNTVCQIEILSYQQIFLYC